MLEWRLGEVQEREGFGGLNHLKTEVLKPFNRCDVGVDSVEC